MRAPALLASAFALAAAIGCGGGGNSGGSITIDNGSTYVITQVRVAPIDQISWGPNLLPDVLYPNERLTVSVACDNYDVLVSDDAGRDCTLGNLDLCFSDRIWTVDNVTLRNCAF